MGGFIYLFFFFLKSSALDFHLTVEEAVLSETSTYENLAHSVFCLQSPVHSPETLQITNVLFFFFFGSLCQRCFFVVVGFVLFFLLQYLATGLHAEPGTETEQ